MKRLALFALIVAFARPVWADEEDEEDTGDEDEEEAQPKKKAPPAEEEEPVDEEKPVRQKQDLNGHDLGTNKKANEFERDRFFVDKVDTENTENSTLIQGSITTSAFAYSESGGTYAGLTGSPNSGPSRMFGDMRLQTDFRHIKASRWDARFDARVRMVNTPPPSVGGAPGLIATD